MRLHLDAVHLLLVLRQMVHLDEALAAHVALEPFTRVPSHVRLQVVALRKAPLAVRTLVRPFAGVHSHVHQQIVRPMEALAARRAQVRLLAGVVALVHRQIGAARKALVAVATLVRLVALVAAHVDGEVVVAHKADAALGAQEGLLVRVHLGVVVGQLVLGGVMRRAELAHEFAVQMELHVRLQRLDGGI